MKVAYVLFLKKGFKEVTIKNITEATKLSKGAVYHHFSSKEEILATLDKYFFGLLDSNNYMLHNICLYRKTYRNRNAFSYS